MRFFLAGVSVTCVVFCVVVLEAQGPYCGGVFDTSKNNNGSGESSHAPYDMGSNVNCLWRFTGQDPTVMVYIFVGLLGLTPSSTFTVMDQGKTNLTLNPEDLLTPLVLAVSVSNSTIALYAGSDVEGSLRRISFHWQLSTEPNSSTMFNNYLGVIKTPKYVPKENITLNLMWVVTGKSDVNGIALAFEKFNMSTGNVAVDFGPSSDPVTKLTGTVIPPDVVFKNTNIRINCSLPIDDEDRGFVAVYKNVYQDCSSRTTLNDSQLFHFNAIRSNLPVKCVSIFEGPVNSTLSATIVKVDSPAILSNSHISFHDGGSVFSNSIGLFPGSALQTNDALLTSGNVLWVSYAFHDTNVPNITLNVSVHNHGGILHDSDSFGVKPSPENVTLPSDTSVWSLVVAADKLVRVDVQSIVANDDDRVSFYDGNAAIFDRLIATFDCNSTVIPIVSSANTMFVVAENFKGPSSFNASFNGVSHGSYVLSSRVYESHQVNTVDGKSNFTWIIRPINTNVTDIIDLTIRVLSITPNISSLVIYEGLTASGTLLANATTVTNSSLGIHISASEGALIVYSNVGETPIAGVLLDAYYNVNAGCLQELDITTGETRISSPSYPNFYPVDADCTYSLVTTPNKSLLLSFEDVNLADGHFVALMNGSTPVFNLTNNAWPDDYLSSNGSKLLLKFVSRSMPTNVTQGRGFSARVMALDCGGLVSDAQSVIHTPGWPNALINSTSCVWSITVPQGKDVRIISLDVEANPVPSSPTVLKFVEGGMLSAGLSSETINASTTNYLSRTSKLMIVYNYTQNQTDPKLLGTPYKFTYTTKDCTPSELCMNGICMHASWRCNGINECGDFTDEYNCTAGPTIETSEGVGVATFVVFIFIMFFTGVAVALAAPTLYRRFRSPRNYQSFGEAVDT